MATTVKEGSKAPQFSVMRDDGKPATLASYAGRPLVLYFYPKDDTSGCTKEAQSFTELAPAFKTLGTPVLGISRDNLASHTKFRDKYGLKVALGADEDGKVCEAYGVWVEKSMYGKKYMGIERSTFLIDGKGVVRHIWRKVKVPGHAQAVLEAAKGLE